MNETDTTLGFDGLIVVTESPATLWAGATWVVLAHWAAGARQLLGNAVVVTRDGLVSDEHLAELATRATRGRDQAPRWRRAVPEPAVTAWNDARRWWRASGSRSNLRRFAPDYARPLVLQSHSLFFDDGLALAEQLGAPGILLVEALQVWEAERWGVRRPGWSRWLEEHGELRILRRADAIACISDEVAHALEQRGVPGDRILTTSNQAAPAFFAEHHRHMLRREHGISEHNRVVGWVGSFRRFHDLDVLFEAFELVAAADPNAVLILVGDGPERPKAERFAARLGAERVRVIGMVPVDDVPRWVTTFDVGVIPARADNQFHYSPLKLHEFLASGIAVVAPRAGEISREHPQQEDLLLYEPGDVRGLADAIQVLLEDPDLRHRLGVNARRSESLRGGTDALLAKIIRRLGKSGS